MNILLYRNIILTWSEKNGGWLAARSVCSACSIWGVVTIWQPLRSRGNVVASHAVGPGSIVGQVNFLVEVFWGFSLNCKTNVRKFGPLSSPGIIWSLSSETIFICLWTLTVSDLRCSTWLSLNKQTTTVLGPTWISHLYLMNVMQYRMTNLTLIFLILISHFH